MELKTIDIKGKEYVTVNERIKYFRENYKDLSLETEIIQIDDEVCILKAVIKNAENRVLATGLAREVNGSSFINKTSYVENCETSAWGRALGNFGIGIDTSMASYEEVANAVKQQDQEQVNKTRWNKFCKEYGKDLCLNVWRDNKLGTEFTTDNLDLFEVLIKKTKEELQENVEINTSSFKGE